VESGEPVACLRVGPIGPQPNGSALKGLAAGTGGDRKSEVGTPRPVYFKNPAIERRFRKKNDHPEEMGVFGSEPDGGGYRNWGRGESVAPLSHHSSSLVGSCVRSADAAMRVSSSSVSCSTLLALTMCSTRSPYLRGASFDISHLRVSTRRRAHWTAALSPGAIGSSASSIISSAQRSVRNARARA
jgi:hypothetical protein